MSELFMMFSILNRNKTEKFVTLYKECGIHVNFLSLGRGN